MSVALTTRVSRATQIEGETGGSPRPPILHKLARTTRETTRTG
jgi:hypothetical protein